jgi:cation diffusion facilitator CzcD-associated flavoprotein CzcO
VVGNSASGLDISDQISKVSKVPVIVSEKPTIVTATTNPALIYKPQIAEFRPEGRTVLFSNGDIESDIDHVVFCTGYFYSFPFLRSLSPPVVTDGASALNLYQHMLYAPDPSISFLGIPQRVVPFPFVEAQMAYLARVWAGRLPFPSEAELRDWERAMKQAQEEGQRNIHVLKFPKDLDYINMMHAKSITADRREGLAHAGMGRPSPYWDEEKAWIRAKMAFIKDASRKLGDARHTILDLKQLGFDFEAEKRRDALQEKLEDGPSLGQTKVPASVAIA